MKLKKRILAAAIILAGGFVLSHQAAEAGMTGTTCVTCHTMHNSQGGVAMNSSQTDAAANDYLLRAVGGACISCHTSTEAGAKLTSVQAPAAHHTSAPGDSGSNAAGSFYYPVLDDTTKGHNPTDLGVADALFTAAGDVPGDGTNLVDPGAFECTSCHVDGEVHHNNSGGDDANVDAVVWVNGYGGSSYRFLTGGILGAEKGDWEYGGGTTSPTKHNIYTSSGTHDTAGRGTDALCATCHGDFHGNGQDGSGGSTSPWARHPTDINMSTLGGEFFDYGSYDVTVPIAAPTSAVGSDDTTIADMTPYDNEDDANMGYVVCLSCHRAHGSPYADMLRWSYATIKAGSTTGANVGCLKCHTAK